ncbi:MAG: asparagine synthase (glutamine-hydrolyzing) [Anaerolineae bacterium]|nr:asparagine synthase (glutamine-hydrolyzing) [Anaerolineae bacterium]
MCGIAGIFGPHPTSQPRLLLDKILDSQHRRGPDFRAVETIAATRGELLLGHNRLSIIDLSAQANQPMWDVDHQCCIIFNGEIYNYIELRSHLETLGHRFVSQSDTEVILEAFKAWKVSALERFNGQFAFGFWDAHEQTLFLCRDRFGKKPLFYYLKHDLLVFASTPQIIAQEMGLSPNLEYVAQGVRYWVYEDASDITPYEGLKALPAGHFLSIKIGQNDHLKSHIQSYYRLHEKIQDLADELSGQPLPTLASRVEECLLSAVTLRLRADVPVGVSLSGGLDSSTVATIAASKHPMIVGFTFGRPDIQKTEGVIANHLAQSINLHQHYIWPDTREVIDKLLEILLAQNAPIFSLSRVAQYFVYQRARTEGVKVLLGGQAGDEVFMGYRKYLLFYFREMLDKRAYLQALSFLFGLVPSIVSEIPQLSLYWQIRHRYTEQDGLETLLDLPVCAPIDLNAISHQPLWKRQADDVTRFSLPMLLRDEDRNSMAHSVEGRLPFTDYRLVELALALPTSLKLRHGYGKWILRYAMRNRIPEEIRNARYKRGFDVQANWLEDGLGSFIRVTLNERYECISHYLRNNVNIDSEFTDEILVKNRIRQADALSLLWLSEHS